MGKFPRRRDWIGLAIVAGATAAIESCRAYYIEPRAWGGLCAAAAPPLACVPRAALLWLQRDYLWGAISLALGLWAFLLRAPFPVRVAAVVTGICGVANYNATWSMLGAALGAWAWVGQRRPRGLCPPGPPSRESALRTTGPEAPDPH